MFATRFRVKEEWRHRVAELRAAEAGIEAANDHDDESALDDWTEAALRLIDVDQRSPSAWRTKIALVSIITGEPFEGSWRPPFSRGQMGFCALDHFAFGLCIEAENKARARADARRRARRNRP